MIYTPDQIAHLESELDDVQRELQTELLDIIYISGPSLRDATACEFATQGVARRLGIVSRCIANVYAVFPPDRTDILGNEELIDVDINLHAFVININGVLAGCGKTPCGACNGMVHG